MRAPVRRSTASVPMASWALDFPPTDAASRRDTSGAGAEASRSACRLHGRGRESAGVGQVPHQAAAARRSSSSCSPLMPIGTAVVEQSRAAVERNAAATRGGAKRGFLQRPRRPLEHDLRLGLRQVGEQEARGVARARSSRREFGMQRAQHAGRQRGGAARRREAAIRVAPAQVRVRSRSRSASVPAIPGTSGARNPIEYVRHSPMAVPSCATPGGR